MNCKKCNGTGNEGFISVIICSDCSGTGIAKEEYAGAESISETIVNKDKCISFRPAEYYIDDGTIISGSALVDDRLELTVTNKSKEPITFSAEASASTSGPFKCLQPLCAGAEVPPSSPSEIILSPINTSYFCAHKIKMMAFDPLNIEANMRFFVGGVSIGGTLQIGNACYANGGPNEIPSDFFYDFVDVDWACFSAFGSGRECKIYVFNPNSTSTSIKIMVLGEPRHELHKM